MEQNDRGIWGYPTPYQHLNAEEEEEKEEELVVDTDEKCKSIDVISGLGPVSVICTLTVKWSEVLLSR